jgi:hypothetical protein
MINNTTFDDNLLKESKNNSNFNIFGNLRSIHALLNRYLSFHNLFNCLNDLPQQLNNPKTRSWQAIDWHDINIDQIVGIDREIFLSILIGAIDTEAPIRGYTQTSRQYLEKVNPAVACFVGGVVDGNDNIIELGLWEKEERQHTPALVKIYQQLTGEKPFLKLPKVRNYQPSSNPYDDLYSHGLHRTLTEYGAACLYLYLAAHTTGTLQQVLTEILQDEINHMVKFWGFGIWLYPDSYSQRLQTIIWNKIKSKICPKSTKDDRLSSKADFLSTFQYMTRVLSWKNWSNCHKTEFFYIMFVALAHLWNYSKQLSPQYLNNILGKPNICDREKIQKSTQPLTNNN